MSDNPQEGEEDFSFTPRGHSEPEELAPSGEQEAPPQSPPPPGPTRLMFQMQVTQQPVDFLLQQYGLFPTEDLRLTVALALNDQTSAWLDAVVRRLADSVLNNN